MGPCTRVATLGVFCAVLVSGCTDPFGLIGPEISVSLALDQVPAAPVSLRVYLDGLHVQLTGTRAERTNKDVRGPRYGERLVRVALLTNAVDTLAAVEFSQRFERNAAHWVSAAVTHRRPLGHCIGALEVVPFRAGGGDTLFVMHGGLPNGSIC